MADFDYDAFIAAYEKCREDVGPSWVIARDVETAVAFAAWCVENDIEEPQIVIRET